MSIGERRRSGCTCNSLVGGDDTADFVGKDEGLCVVVSEFPKLWDACAEDVEESR